MNVTEVLLHPVRLRVIHALSASDELAITELCERMPEISKSTVYRHVAVLLDAGLLEVGGERRVRGAIERSYRLRRDRPTLDSDDASAMTLDEYRRSFAAAVMTLLAEFNSYLDRAGANPTADSVSYRQSTIWATPEELTALRQQLITLLAPTLANQPTSGRRPYLLSPILFPSDKPTDALSIP
ncbi:helix-turn-helix domain-containing protein [Rathayibacter soli]|uniref:helix-turn-helix domain-containing protein n=1 Tax=Rathayibacter soli TaxID=3144168 RepID=UPI0027E3E85E|nr:helix-turn-helix domain-containing protein [Glaciibacter superstes]